MKNIGFSDVKIRGGYWKARQEVNNTATLNAVYASFLKTHRFDALKCTWKDGDPDEPHIFWDSDVAKWLEGASYVLKSVHDEKIEEIIEGAIDDIIENSDADGYFNSHYLVTEQEERFRNRGCHELYCAGHLFEAAVAYYEVTGKDRFLKAMCRYADYIERLFKTERCAGFSTPGHPEIELALMRLYRATGEKRYADLAKFFIDEHGKHPEDNLHYLQWANERCNQDEMPIRDRKSAEGHCVRAMYLLCGAADVAAEYGDLALEEACKRCFDNIVSKRMYITGGIGSTHIGEAFTVDYDLPNRTAYTETCAAISLAMFANRMLQFGADSKYADIVEKEIYNGALSGVSMDGKSFFYENPLEIDPDFNNVNASTNKKERYPRTQRAEMFDVSCCPPNILRFVASAGGYIYGIDDEVVYVHQYADSEAAASGLEIEQTTDYPTNGRIKVRCKSDRRQIAFRIPGWCGKFSISRAYEMKRGYAYVELCGDDEIELEFDMTVRLISANRRVHSDAGRIAVMRGPVVYCAEGVDNGEDVKSISLDINAEFETAESEFLLPVLKTTGRRPADSDSLYSEAGDDYEELQLTLIPYYAFANRGETEMHVWLLRERN